MSHAGEGLPFRQIDAFSDRPFAGNPAAVFILDGPREARWMQAVAGEMNLSETAFVWPLKGACSLRWFTPVTEVPLCGHATLASAHALYESGLDPGEPARFHTKSGLLTARKKGAWIELDLPALREKPVPAPAGLARALGARPAYVGRGPGTYLVLLDSERAVRALEPDFKALAAIHGGAFIVTAPCASGRYDFVSRCFAPGEGIDEDPVTGSAHCCLGPFWSKRLGRDSFLAHQASSRGGTLKVAVEGERVRLEGQAVTVFRGRLAARACQVPAPERA